MTHTHTHTHLQWTHGRLTQPPAYSRRRASPQREHASISRPRRFYSNSTVSNILQTLRHPFFNLFIQKANPSEPRKRPSLLASHGPHQASSFSLDRNPLDVFVDETTPRMAQSLSPDNPHHDCRHLFYSRLHRLSGRGQRRRSRSLQAALSASAR